MDIRDWDWRIMVALQKASNNSDHPAGSCMLSSGGYVCRKKTINKRTGMASSPED